MVGLQGARRRRLAEQAALWVAFRGGYPACVGHNHPCRKQSDHSFTSGGVERERGMPKLILIDINASRQTILR